MIAKPYSFFKRLIENVLFLRPHRSFGWLRDELRRQNGFRTGGVQRIPESRRRCRGGVKKRITFIGRRRRTSQTAARESPRSLCIARSQDVRRYQLSVYVLFPRLTKILSRAAGIAPESFANCFTISSSSRIWSPFSLFVSHAHNSSVNDVNSNFLNWAIIPYFHNHCSLVIYKNVMIRGEWRGNIIFFINLVLMEKFRLWLHS